MAIILTPIFTSIFTILWTRFFAKPGFIKEIGNYIWGLFFAHTITTGRVQSYYKEIGDRIIQVQREENFYDVIYEDRTDMFGGKKLYQELGESITYICLSVDHLSQEGELPKVMKELKNKNISIYVLDALSGCAQSRNNEFDDLNLPEYIKTSVFRFADALEKYSGKDYKEFNIYKYDNVPYLTGVILKKSEKDVEYYITHHLFYTRAQECLSFRVTKSDKAYTIYKEMFDAFIEKNKENIILNNKGHRDAETLEKWGYKKRSKR
jgi:hypothetical protein